MNRTVRLVEEILAVALLLAACYPLLYYVPLADVAVPKHMSGDMIDSYGGRTIFIWLPVLALAVYGLLWFAQKHPRFVNLPGVAPEQHDEVSVAVASALKMWTAALFALLSLGLYGLATERIQHLPGWWIYGVIAAMTLHVILLVVMASRKA